LNIVRAKIRFACVFLCQFIVKFIPYDELDEVNSLISMEFYFV